MLPPVRPAVAQIKPVNREVELKFLVGESGFKAVQQWPLLGLNGRRAPSRRLHTVYFDTEQGDLQRHKMVLRMRSMPRGHMMTLKWSGGFPGGIFERGEIEVMTAQSQPDPALFGAEMAGMIHDATQGRALSAIYATDIRRATHMIRSETSSVEIAFDAGGITAGDVTMPIREIELELKAGEVADLYRLGVALAEQFPVRLGMLAKSDRGNMLAAGTRPESVRSHAVLDGTPTVDEAIGRAINSCLAQFAANWPAFETGDAIGAVHQMRVALRRLRAILGLFQRAFPCPEFISLREEAKQIAALLGEARNLDVFMSLVREGPLAAFPDELGFEEIIADCEQRQEAAYEAARLMLAAPATTRFVLSAQAFVARSGWRNALPGEALPRLTVPAQEFASQNLSRLHHKLLKRGKHIVALSPHQRHELRIGLKKLRYVAELFGPMFNNPTQVKTYTKAAARLQDQLGIFNDLNVAIQMVHQINGANSRAAGIILGWCGRGAATDDDVLREDWRSFRKARLFWD
ncbi:MAG: CHAD domain-containing protein [Acidocella sp.]|nr:CHAD domain-containing protein [Acidocella sp.]